MSALWYRTQPAAYWKQMSRPAGDSELVQIVDAALADAARRAGEWLVCRPGCAPCCHGVFASSPLDAERLREGLALLTAADPGRATLLRERVAASIARLGPGFPVDAGMLDEEAFAGFAGADNEPCPVLAPGTGTCDLYAHRPMTCRVFGPPVQSEDGLGHCELCFLGATEEQVVAAEMHLTFGDLEDRLNAELQIGGSTTVAFALHNH